MGKKPRSEPESRSRIVVILGAIAAVAALLSQVETIHDKWCKYIGNGCTFEVSSAEVTVYAGGTPDGRSDECKSKAPEVCVEPSAKRRKLDVSSGRFVARRVQNMGGQDSD